MSCNGRKRVPWDGPHPVPGHYLESRQRDMLWLIRSVTPLPRPDVSGAVLTLEITNVPKSEVPADGVVIHPIARITPHDPLGPPRVRQVQPNSEAAVMSARWRDPEDMRANARAARDIRGFRIACALRKMQIARGSQIKETHIAAADQFRLTADIAILGLSPVVDYSVPVTAIGYQPKLYISATAEEQAAAARELRRTLNRFTPDQQLMLLRIIYLNQSLYVWCNGVLNAQVEMGRLLTILDTLAKHYAVEVNAALADRQVRAA